MVNPFGNIKKCASQVIDAAFAVAVSDGVLKQAEAVSYTVEQPADTKHGDLATNVAMVSAKQQGKAPRMIAEEIIKRLDFDGTPFSSAQIAGPGFINFTLKKSWFGEVITDVLSAGYNYGRTEDGKGEKVMVEFVSANPTGPMHMGNARGGALGDGIAEVLSWAGHDVTREFYVNDAGNQIDRFGKSLDARYRQKYLGEEAVEFPEDGYHGDDIKDLAEEYAAIVGDSLLSLPDSEREAKLAEFGLPKNIERMKRDLEKYRIEYDSWFYESSFHNDGSLDRCIEKLSALGLTYEKDGALWYKASLYGGEKDEVLVRTNKTPTYFAADIAYHLNKFVDRGFNRVINVWGADHHGHVARLVGAMDAAEVGGQRLKIVIMQMVRLMRGGEMVRMSKRTGRSVSLSDLLDEVPIDAARFFFNLREAGATFDFDLDLAVTESNQNPVYYVQYAHARISSIIKNIEAEGIKITSPTTEQLALLEHSAEVELTRKLAHFPEVISSAARNLDPTSLTHFAQDVASLFHRFYDNCRCRLPEEPDLMNARLALCTATKTVIANILKILKVSTPDVM